ncbi:hypothetical protein L1049_017952 [Liquidambar formosana]|uniref:Uncharacterized protein n=1 Tax=Liquidambar formosana TaxID=63359 RepID=A0AAP0NHV6_LIQFO
MCGSAEKTLMADLYQIPGPPQFEEPAADEMAISLCIQDLEYIEKIKELQAYLDKVKKIVKPGCSQELIDVALDSVASLVDVLSRMSSTSKPHASL